MKYLIIIAPFGMMGTLAPGFSAQTNVGNVIEPTRIMVCNADVFDSTIEFGETSDGKAERF